MLKLLNIVGTVAAAAILALPGKALATNPAQWHLSPTNVTPPSVGKRPPLGSTPYTLWTSWDVYYRSLGYGNETWGVDLTWYLGRTYQEWEFVKQSPANVRDHRMVSPIENVSTTKRTINT